MRKSEIFSAIVDKVAEVCELPRECIIKSCKHQAVVDARMLAVQYLIRAGISADDVALFAYREEINDPTAWPPMSEIKRRARGVNKQFNEYSKRCLENPSFRILSREISLWAKQKLCEALEEEIKELSGN